MTKTRVSGHPRKGTKGVKPHSRTVNKTGTVPHNIDDQIVAPEDSRVEHEEGYLDTLRNLLFSFFHIEIKRENVSDLIKFDEDHNTAIIKHIDEIIPLDNYRKVSGKEFEIRERVVTYEGRPEKREYYYLDGTGFDKVELDQVLLLDSMDARQILFRENFPLVIKSTDNDYSVLKTPLQLEETKRKITTTTYDSKQSMEQRSK